MVVGRLPNAFMEDEEEIRRIFHVRAYLADLKGAMDHIPAHHHGAGMGRKRPNPF